MGHGAYFKATRRPDGTFVTEGAHRRRFGHELPSTVHDRADGIWARWEWDGARLRVETDRYGFMPIFYAAFDDTVIVSPSLVEVIRQGAPRDIDVAALGVFCTWVSI